MNLLSIECAAKVLEFIKMFKSPEDALKELTKFKGPRKNKRGKKLLCKMIRAYIFEMKLNEQA